MNPVRRTALLLSLAGFLAFAPSARATGGGSDAAVAVPIQVQVIAASVKETGKEPEIDKRLSRLRKRLSDFAFSSYRLVEEKSLLLALNREESLALPGERTLVITPRAFEKNGKIRVHLLIRSSRATNLVDTDYSIEPGGDILVGGMKLEDGALLVAIRHGD